MIQDEFKEAFSTFGLTVEQVKKRLAEVGMGDYGELITRPSKRRWAHFAYFAAASMVLNGAKNVLEIGTGSGLSTDVLARLFPAALVYTIDVGPDDPLWKQTWLGGHPEKPCAYYNNLSHENIKVIESNSFFLSLFDLPKRFSLIFVDGDHKYPAVSADISFAYSRLERGGFLFIHDYTEKEHDVRHAVGWLAERIEEKVHIWPAFTHEKVRRDLKVACIAKGRV